MCDQPSQKCAIAQPIAVAAAICATAPGKALEGLVFRHPLHDLPDKAEGAGDDLAVIEGRQLGKARPLGDHQAHQRLRGRFQDALAEDGGELLQQLAGVA